MMTVLDEGVLVVVIKEMDFLQVFLELPVINKSLFPLRHKLTLKLLRKLLHP
jgi:hypothetical protein